jgi:hypothetical protein
LLAALVLGLATGYVALAFAVVLGDLRRIQVWNLVRLERWLRRRRIETPPDFSSAVGRGGAQSSAASIAASNSIVRGSPR